MKNQFLVEHFPVAAYVRYLKEKKMKKWNSVFLSYLVWNSSFVELQDSIGEIRTNEEHFSLKNENEIKNSQPGSYKKKSVYAFKYMSTSNTSL